MQWELVESDLALEELLAQHAGYAAVAVDTEFMRRDTFYPEVALLQLCFGDRAWLIDPLCIDDTGPLQVMLQDSRTIKVLHSASEDLEVFDRWLGVLPEPLFDTQRAAALIDHGFGMGYRALVLDLQGIDLPKGETRSDWLRRPLSESQCDYAAQDVAHLLPLWEQLQAVCVGQGKLDWVLSDGADALAAFRGGGSDPVQRIKSAWKLDRRGLGRLVALCAWREATARSRNRPRGWILDDATCFAIAQRDADSRSGLERAGVAAATLRRDGDSLLALLAAERARPEGELPERLPAPLEGPARKQLQRLKERARSIAGGLAVAPEILLQGRDYEILVRQHAGEPLPDPAAWHGWRRTRVIEPLRQTLLEYAA